MWKPARTALALLALPLSLGLALASAPAHAETRVAVLYFDNHTSDPAFDALGKGLADMIITDLGQVPGLVMVERARLEALLTEQKLQKSKLSDPATAVKVGKLAGAKYAITGALTAVDPELRVDMRLIEIQTAKVIVSEKVIGKKAEFFALEQQLVTRFAAALQAKVPAVAAAASGGVDAALAYGQALELADNGDLQAASKRLGEAVAKAPDFKLAQTRYADILQRLYAARDTRNTQLGGNAKALADKVEQVLSERSTGLKGRALGRWFGYRILKGRMLLKAISKLVGTTEDPFAAVRVPAAKHPELKRLITDWVANWEALVVAMVDARKRNESRMYSITGVVIDDEDDKRAESLDLGMSPHMLSFGEPQIVYRELGGFLCEGKTPFGSDIEIHMSPTPWELDPTWQKQATAAYDNALTDIKAHASEYIRDREAMRTYDAYGTCLIARGKKIEGLMRWQTALEQYPTSDEFTDLEQKVRDALQK